MTATTADRSSRREPQQSDEVSTMDDTTGIIPDGAGGRTTAESEAPQRRRRLPGEPPRTRWGKIRRRVLHDPIAMAALVVLVIVVVCALIPGVIATHDPIATNLPDALQGPSGAHWLGTDNLGRDVFSRLVFASRIAVLAAAEAAGIAMLIGIPVGLIVGFVGGRLDNIVMRIVDGFTSLPGLIVAIAVIAAMGPGIHNAMLAVGLVFSTTFVRVTRGEVLSARRQQYVEAAEVIGTRSPAIMVRHILPNVVGPIAVQVSLTLAAALLVEAALSFLGLGAQPPDASWGVMISEAGTMLAQDPFLIFPPGIAIGLTVLSLNVLADTVLGALRDEPVRTRWRKHRAALTPVATPGESATAATPSKTSATRTSTTPASTTGAPRTQPPDTGAPDPHATLSVRGMDVLAARASSVIPVIDDVSLDVHPGETLGLVGESGSGKTMTALAVMGLLPQNARRTRGGIWLDGADLAAMSGAQLRDVRGSRIAMIFQEPGSALDPAFTIGNQIIEVLRHHKGLSKADAREKAEHLLERVGIREPRRRMRSYPHELSGGMAQRVMIALAISCDPALLIADEPTTALDVTLKIQVADLLKDIQQESGMSMVFVTHELGMVAEVADRVAVMYAGEVVEERTIDELMAAPRHPYTAALLESSAQGTPRGTELGTIPGSVPSPGNRPTGCRFAPRCAFATADCTAAAPALTVDGDSAVRCIHPRSGHAVPLPHPAAVPAADGLEMV
ncbi:dipeptide/oligopeptide/nickel ABC transporter permease/ATP-binding protein [Tomitella gaofuii]|uniref:dipeptide/oligopeptide/nickel ABC transporter permease/ATP-binding protein n=1 Tax=Tomitella gaofuii TaxID=2760083 RepID=UPI0015FAAF87|nr:dipeptide/oligopeptide/nickel ABC transporter permease/ATP-binding protein [Tomitella gaofuii]